MVEIGVVAIDGDDGEIARGALVGTDLSIGAIRGVDANIIGTNEAAVIAEHIHALGGIAGRISETFIVRIDGNKPPVVPGVGLGGGHEQVNPSGPIHRVGDTAIVGIAGAYFRFPHCLSVNRQRSRHSGCPGLEINAIIIVIRDDAHVCGDVRVVHGDAVEVGVALPVLTFGKHDLRRGDIAGNQGIVKAGDKIVELLCGPRAGRIAGGGEIRLVLDGDGVGIDALRIFHCGHVPGELIRVGLVIGRDIITAIQGSRVFEGNLRAPRGAPDLGAKGLGLLRDAEFAGGDRPTGLDLGADE